ncbi:MBL fold metallo-hydrolase [Candidatus Atribacteria bacterium MT.SAG.1]|nr:MBL fold metallo-hydrolase [Candidatus Atribacteria bacterium MT.SAG.1]
MFLKRLVVGALETNCYLIGCKKTKRAAVIDPGGEEKVDLILDILEKNNFKLEYIINTHGHTDHIAGNNSLKTKTEALLLIHRLDADMLSDANKNFSSFMGKEICSPPADKLLEEGDEISLGKLKLIIIHTPGHTPGGICLVLNSIVFTGDTLFAGGIGRTDLPGGSYQDLQKSIKEKLLALSDDKIIYPGHGPDSTIGEERRKNPYILID